MWIVSAPGVKSRSGHRRASKFAGPHALMHGHVEIRGKGRWRQLVSQGDKVRDVGLGWRLHVRAPATLLEPQAGKRVDFHEPTGVRALGLVEERALRRDGAVVACSAPLADDLVVNGADRLVALALHKGARALGVVQVGGLGLASPRCIGRPLVPELADGDAQARVVAQERASCVLGVDGVGLFDVGARAADDGLRADVLGGARGWRTRGLQRPDGRRVAIEATSWSMLCPALRSPDERGCRGP
jgi:hypothetical protein